MDDVVIVGGGVIGLSIAWRLAQRTISVTVVDPNPGGGASTVAAGMLAPVSELHYEGRELLGLNLESARRYPAFVAELEEVTGLRVGYVECGTLQVAWDAADLAELRDLQAFQQSLGLHAQVLSSRELRAAEPELASGLPGGLLAADDHQVDNRALHAALLRAAPPVIRRRAVAVAGGGVTLDDGTVLRAGTVVLAAGAWSRQLAELVPVRPVKGQTLRLSTAPLTLTRVVRGSVKGKHVYLVPRPNGELVIGASSEEAGFDVRARAGAVYELLRDAQALVPGVSEVELREVSTGLRPGSPDNAPMLGRWGDLVIATGHYRNGILLTPVTADEIARLIVDGASEVIAPFAPELAVAR